MMRWRARGPASTELRSRDVRVLLVTPDYPPALGGIQQLLHRITSAMPHATILVVTPDAEGGSAFDAAADVAAERVPIRGRTGFARNVSFIARGLLRLPDWRPDVVLNGHLATSPLAYAASRKYGVPLIQYVHGKEVIGRPRLAAWALRRSAAAIAVSEFTRRLLVETVRGHAHPPVHVVHPGVQIVGMPPARPSGGPFTLITVGRLRDWYKGHDVVLEALPHVLAQMPQTRWVVIGEGRRRRALEERAAALGVAHAVTFLGAVSDADKHLWLQRADVFVMPARYPEGEVGGEGFAMVYLEAAAWAVPSIAGDAGGPREAVVDRSTGLLVDPESVEQVAAAIIELGTKPALTRELGEQARRRVEAAFTWDRVARQLEAVIRDVCVRVGSGNG